jgi:hypothetical protein
MKVIGKFQITERELKEMIANYFGVTKDDVTFECQFKAGQFEEDIVNCTVRKTVDIPGSISVSYSGFSNVTNSDSDLSNSFRVVSED